jgi:ATP-dependent RNA helicase DeaD
MSSPHPFDALSPPIRAAMQRRGFEQLTPVQQAVVEADPGGRDLRISSQTGSGKTVALGLALAPALTEAGPTSEGRGPRALVLAPTRELAAQVARELGALYADLKLEVQVVTGGTDPVRERRALKRRPTLLVATPGRLLDHVRGGAVELSGVHHAVLDEADQMLDLGFRDELDAILELLPSDRRLHMVSATFAREVLRFADRCQKDVLHLQGSRLGDANADIDHIAHLVLPQERHAALVNLLLADHASGGGSWLVFVRTRADTTELAELLVEDGFSAMPFSGELSQSQRDRTLSAFENGLVKVLIATDVAARGIDVRNISHVVHYEVPSDAESFTHRSGRTGRAGQKGRSILLVAPSRERRARDILKRARVEASWQPVPDAKRIEKTAIKKTRRALHARLDAGEEAAAKQLEYARGLLEKHDPAMVVAVLLDMVRTDLPRDPTTVRALEPRGEGSAVPGPRRDRWGRDGWDGRRDHGPRRGRDGGPKAGSGPRRSKFANARRGTAPDGERSRRRKGSGSK